MITTYLHPIVPLIIILYRHATDVKAMIEGVIESVDVLKSVVTLTLKAITNISGKFRL